VYTGSNPTIVVAGTALGSGPTLFAGVAVIGGGTLFLVGETRRLP
jgi:hypothetical protein